MWNHTVWSTSQYMHLHTHTHYICELYSDNDWGGGGGEKKVMLGTQKIAQIRNSRRLFLVRNESKLLAEAKLYPCGEWYADNGCGTVVPNNYISTVQVYSDVCVCTLAELNMSIFFHLSPLTL